MNPIPFLPTGWSIEPGPPDRKVRADMAVNPIPPLNNNFLAIAEASRFVPLYLRAGLRETIEGLLHESGLLMMEVSDHPLGIGMFAYADSFIRDTAVNTMFQLDDEELVISFVRHKAALNMCKTTYGPEVWLLYIGFPDDYQTNFYLQRSVDDYGRLVSWNNPHMDRRVVLIKVHIIHMHLIPKSIVVHQLGGDRDCWTVSVNILRGADWNAHDPEVPLADEEPPPANGIPHPMFGDGLTVEQLYQQQLHNWLLQNGIGNDPV